MNVLYFYLQKKKKKYSKLVRIQNENSMSIILDKFVCYFEIILNGAYEN